jgi:hypothetical protein
MRCFTFERRWSLFTSTTGIFSWLNHGSRWVLRLDSKLRGYIAQRVHAEKTANDWFDLDEQFVISLFTRLQDTSLVGSIC